MAYSSSSSDSEVSNDSTCSKSYLETIEVLKSQYEQLFKRFEKSELMVVAYKTGLQSVEERLEFYKKNESIYVKRINGLKWDIQVGEITIGELRKKLEIIVDNCKKGLGYNVVSPLLTGNFMPPKPDLSFTGLEEFTSKPVVIQPIVKNSEAKASEAKPKAVRKNNGAPIIEDWVSDSEEENVSQTKIEKKTTKPSFVKIDFVKAKQTNKTDRKTAKQVDCNYQRVVKLVWNNAKRVNHQNFAKKTHPCAKKNIVPRVVPMKSGLVSINTARQNISKATVLVNTARQVNDAHTKTTVNAARPKSYLSKTSHSTVKRPIHKNTTFKNSNINQRVNTVRGKNVNTIRPKVVVNAARQKAVVNAARPKAVVNAVKGNRFQAVKASACWVWKPKNRIQVSDGLGPQKKLIFLSSVQGNPQIDLKDQRVIDSGCSRHMTWTMSYLIDYGEIDRGYVAFGGNPKGGKIIGKGKSCKSSHDDGSKPSSDDKEKVDDDPRKESECNNQEKDDNVNNTNTVNVAGTNEVNDVGGNMSIKLLFDPLMHALEEDN
ncbi:hypothetical protein Tco_0608595 [Tanacetum coccineum]